MAQPIETHINAFYADLATAKTEAAVANQKVIELEQIIESRGHPLPEKDGSIPEPKTEDAVQPDDVSAAETKPLEKMNREELNVAANDAGVEDAESLETKKDVIEAIREKETE